MSGYQSSRATTRYVSFNRENKFRHRLTNRSFSCASCGSRFPAFYRSIYYILSVSCTIYLRSTCTRAVLLPSPPPRSLLHPTDDSSGGSINARARKAAIPKSVSTRACKNDIGKLHAHGYYGFYFRHQHPTRVNPTPIAYTYNLFRHNLYFISLFNLYYFHLNKIII